RRFQGTPKYLQIAGGSTRGLYGADLIRPEQPVFMVEGELDALIGQQVLGHTISVVTTGSASYPLRQRWVKLIDKAPKIVLCMDQDAAGAKSAAHLLQSLPHAKIVHIPFGKDLTDFYL